MSIFKPVLQFLFGKPPEIFDENGRVEHQFSDEKWKKWNDRLQANPDYNWQQHSAKEKALKGQKATTPHKS